MNRSRSIPCHSTAAIATKRRGAPDRVESGNNSSLRESVTSGFTLVELLVAMTIFLILATLTVTAFRGNDSDRISAATATLRNAIEGARSRAVKSGQIRGLRLFTDPSNNQIVTSLQYVGPPGSGYDEGSGTLTYSTSTGSWQLASTTANWTNFTTRGILSTTKGSRVEIPRGSGNWYPSRLTGATLSLFGHYQPCRWDGTILPSGGYEAVPGTTVDYRLELLPTPLAGSEPILLPRNTCIDLVGSAVPGGWGPSVNMDILFTPSGNLTGDVKSKGLVHFVISNVGDLILSPTGRTAGQVIANPEKGHRLVSLFSATGGVVASEINPTYTQYYNGTAWVSGTAPADTYNNQLSSDPYYYAIRGKEAK